MTDRTFFDSLTGQSLHAAPPLAFGGQRQEDWTIRTEPVSVRAATELALPGHVDDFHLFGDEGHDHHDHDHLDHGLSTVDDLPSPPPGEPQAEYVSILNTGDSANRIDMWFVGDGYLASQKSDFVADVEAQLAYMFGNDLNDPFGRYENYFNVHGVFKASAEEGADKPLDDVFVDTAFDASYSWGGSVERCLYFDTGKAEAALQEVIPADADVEMRFGSVNDAKYGGCGGFYGVYSAKNPNAGEVAVHEIGHSYANLADEYWTNGTTYSGGEPGAVNVTADPTGSKWSHWLGYDDGNVGPIGAYEGAFYNEFGAYRPSDNSKMRSLGRHFDAVSKEKFILDFYEDVDPLDWWSFQDNETGRKGVDILRVDPIDENVVVQQWFLDGTELTGETGLTLDVTTLGLGVGQHTITAQVTDPTDKVRINLDNLVQEVSWTVDIVAGQVDGTSAGDKMTGTAAAEIMIGYQGNDRINALEGDDEIFGGVGNDRLIGWTGDDIISGGEGGDTIFGKADNDTIYGDYGHDYIDGGVDNDTVYGNVGNDELRGNLDDDLIHGGVGNDTIFGGNAIDTLFGEEGHDYIDAGNGNDVAAGGLGDDTLRGITGLDDLSGGEGNDTILGGGGFDQLFGDDGDDYLDGGNGNDSIFGGAGDDELRGNLRNDLLNGGLGDDTLRGGGSLDTFAFSGFGFGTDRIADWVEGETMDLSGNGLSFGDLTITQDGATTNILISSLNSTIRLSSVDMSTIDAGDFLF